MLHFEPSLDSLTLRSDVISSIQILPLLKKDVAFSGGREKEFFIGTLLVRIHVIIEIILVDQPCVIEVWIPLSR